MLSSLLSYCRHSQVDQTVPSTQASISKDKTAVTQVSISRLRRASPDSGQRLYQHHSISYNKTTLSVSGVRVTSYPPPSHGCYPWSCHAPAAKPEEYADSTRLRCIGVWAFFEYLLPFWVDASASTSRISTGLQPWVAVFPHTSPL